MKKNNLFISLALALCLSACGTGTQNESSEDTVSTAVTIIDTSMAFHL